MRTRWLCLIGLTMWGGLLTLCYLGEAWITLGILLGLPAGFVMSLVMLAVELSADPVKLRQGFQ